MAYKVAVAVVVGGVIVEVLVAVVHEEPHIEDMVVEAWVYLS